MYLFIYLFYCVCKIKAEVYKIFILQCILLTQFIVHWLNPCHSWVYLPQKCKDWAAQAPSKHLNPSAQICQSLSSSTNSKISGRGYCTGWARGCLPGVGSWLMHYIWKEIQIWLKKCEPKWEDLPKYAETDNRVTRENICSGFIWWSVWVSIETPSFFSTGKLNFTFLPHVSYCQAQDKTVRCCKVKNNHKIMMSVRGIFKGC